MKSFQLENGLKVYIYERHNLPIFNMSLAFDVGSKNETKETSGLTHLLEHYILFRGTEFRSGSAVSRDVRRHGAYFNAATGQDLSFYEISLPSEYADFALRNQREILFNLAFSEEELEREKEVILEEISQLEDDPAKFATDLVLQSLFRGHPYGNSVFGRKEVIRGATAEALQAFYKKFYVPNNCALAAVGDFGLEEMEAKIRAVFGDMARRDLDLSSFSKPAPPGKKVEISAEMDIQKAYLAIGIAAPAYAHPEQPAIDVLTEILGRGINPMLLAALRARRDLARTLSVRYYINRYGGALLFMITLDPGNIETVKREAVDFLRQVWRQNLSRDDVMGEAQYYAFDYLQNAKNQILFTGEKAQENGLVVASSLAKFLLFRDRDNVPNYLQAIREISSSDLRQAAGAYLSRGDYVFVSILPIKKRKNEKDGPRGCPRP